MLINTKCKFEKVEFCKNRQNFRNLENGLARSKNSSFEAYKKGLNYSFDGGLGLIFWSWKSLQLDDLRG